MTQNQNTLPEAEFLKALETLENLAKGAVPNGEGEDLEKSVEAQAEGATAEESATPAAPEGEVIQKGGDGDNDEDDEDEDDKDDMEKSNVEGLDPIAGAEQDTFDEIVDGSESISKAIEVSDFLAELVTKICSAVDSIRKSVDDRMNAMEKSLTDSVARGQQVEQAFIDALKKSFQAVTTKTDEQAEELRKSIEGMGVELGKMPARNLKSKTTVLEKSFGENSEPKTISKSGILKSLTSMVEAGDPDISSMDVLRFESGGYLTPAVKKKLGLE